MKNEFTLEREDFVMLMALTGMYTASIVLANVLAGKLFALGPWIMTAGILAYPFTFILTDILNEVWGPEVAKKAVYIGISANILMVLLFYLGIALPPAPVWGGQEGFAQTLGAVPRMVMASMMAFIISQAVDVALFDFFRRQTRFGLWFRNIGSTTLSQVLDSTIFLFVAFWGVMDFPQLVTMLVTYIVVKALIAVVESPLCYLGVHIVRKKRGDIQ